MSETVFQMPEKVSMERVDDHCSTFTFAPLEQGYGVTIGNAFRRVLLSSLEGYAITSVKIPGVQHEFSTIPGIKEDVVELVLNLKQVRFRKIADSTQDKVSISLSKQKVFKAGDIAKFTPFLEVVNPDFVICHLNASDILQLELTIEKGRGYIPADEHKPTNAPIGLIPIDAIFTPIKSVSYQVAHMRVAQRTDYEKLIMDVRTDGSIHPEQALAHAARVIVKHFLLVSDGNVVSEAPSSEEAVLVDEELLRVRKLLKTPLADLELSARAFNCLKAVGLATLGDLVVLEVADMVKFRNFGNKSLEELEKLMESKGFHFGMDVSKYRSGAA